MTPHLPTWIREHRVRGYTNVFALLPEETRLFGTEDLYGDWDGHVLLFAKDFACSQLVRARIEQGDPRPYRHEPTLRTNIALRRYADPLRSGPTPLTCGLLYGSALACLLRDDGEMSGALPSRKEAIAFGTRVVSFVVEHMPNLEVIVCLGQEAWQCTMGSFNTNGSWQTTRDSRKSVHIGIIAMIAAYHPAARISHDTADGPWELVRDALSGPGRVDRT